MRFLYFLVLIGLIACKSGSGESDNANTVDLDQLHEEALAIHDEVMPKMSVLTNLQSQLSDHLKVLKSQQPIDMAKLKTANEVLGQLNRAESAMWDWMDRFSALDTIAQMQKEAFLMREKASAEDMKALMLASIEAAEQYLKVNSTATESNENM